MENLTIAVTGGAGFVGSHICHLLGIGANEEKLNFTCTEVRIIDLRPPRKDNTLLEVFKGKNKPKLSLLEGSILDIDFLEEAFKGVDVVIHAASLVDFGQNPKELIMKVNVEGISNVIEACRRNDVKALVYTSTLETISRKVPNVELQDSAPYPEDVSEFLGGYYGFSKSLAERSLFQANNSITANGVNRLYTASIRPRGVYGEEDAWYLVNILRQARAGSLKFQFGSADNKIDHMYAGNVAWAHLCALDKILLRPQTIGGRPFNLSFEPKRSLGRFMEPYLGIVGAELPELRLSLNFLLWLAFLVEVLLSLIPRPVRPHVPFNRMVVRSIATEQTASPKGLKEDLEFEPYFSMKQAEERTKLWLKSVWLKRESEEKLKQRHSGISAKIIGFGMLMALLFSIYL